MARGRGQDRQLPLFGEPEPGAQPQANAPRNARRVGPAPVPDALRELADALPNAVRLGTSSWSFPGWKGLVYDRESSTSHLARHGLAAYARHPLLRAVGIDRTYYAPIGAETFAECAAAVPEDFRFLVKAANLCTDPWRRGERGRVAGENELFLDAGFATEQVVRPYVEGLGRKAGVLVFQFPPLGSEITRQPQRFTERLVSFLQALPRGPTYAVELRDRELFDEPYLSALRDTGAQHCYTAHPRMPSVADQRRRVGNAGMLVGRWMLHAGLGYEQARGRYAPFSRLVDEASTVRAELAGLCVAGSQSGREVIVVANNKAEGSAPLTVFKLATEIAERLEAGPASRTR